MSCFDQPDLKDIRVRETGATDTLSHQYSEETRPQKLAGASPKAGSTESNFIRRGYAPSLAADYQASEDAKSPISVDRVLDKTAAQKAFKTAADEIISKTDGDAEKLISDLVRQRDSDPAIAKVQERISSYSSEMSAVFSGIRQPDFHTEMQVRALKYEQDAGKKEQLTEEIRSRNPKAADLVAQGKFDEALKATDPDAPLLEKVWAFISSDNPDKKAQLLTMIASDHPEIADHLSKANAVNATFENDQAYDKLQHINLDIYRAADMRVMVRHNLSWGYDSLDQTDLKDALYKEADEIANTNRRLPSGHPKDATVKASLVREGFAPLLAEDMQAAMAAKGEVFTDKTLDPARAQEALEATTKTLLQKTDADAEKILSNLVHERNTDPAILEMKHRMLPYSAEIKAAFDAIPKTDSDLRRDLLSWDIERDPNKKAELLDSIRTRDSQMGTLLTQGKFDEALKRSNHYSEEIALMNEIVAFGSAKDPEQKAQLLTMIGPDHPDIVAHVTKADAMNSELTQDQCYEDAFHRWTNLNADILRVFDMRRNIRNVLAQGYDNLGQEERSKQLKTEGSTIISEGVQAFRFEENPQNWKQ
jgi:hypothetical protein